MSHLETAYRLGALHAGRDFETQLKEAAAVATSRPAGSPDPGQAAKAPTPAVTQPGAKLTTPGAQNFGMSPTAQNAGTNINVAGMRDPGGPKVV